MPYRNIWQVERLGELIWHRNVIFTSQKSKMNYFRFYFGTDGIISELFRVLHYSFRGGGVFELIFIAVTVSLFF